MTRNEKIKKLGNAIRELRGAKYEDKWIRSPKPSAAPRVLAWLKKLGLDTPESHAKIQQLKTIEQFNEWIGNL